jgi:hypothetical protein
MLEAIEANRQRSDLSDGELTTLLSEVRAVGSRWVGIKVISFVMENRTCIIYDMLLCL